MYSENRKNRDPGASRTCSAAVETSAPVVVAKGGHGAVMQSIGACYNVIMLLLLYVYTKSPTCNLHSYSWQLTL